MESSLWIVICLFAIVIELINPASLICIWFAIGALFAYLAAILNLNTVIQIAVFLVASFLALVLVRPLAKKYFQKNVVATNADRIIGRELTLIKGVENEHWGEVKCDGVVWNTKSINDEVIPEGATIEVVAIDGSKLLVKKIER